MSLPDDPKQMREMCYKLLAETPDDHILEVLETLIAIQEHEIAAARYVAKLQAKTGNSSTGFSHLARKNFAVLIEARAYRLRHGDPADNLGLILREIFNGLTDNEVRAIIDEPYG